MGFIPSPQLSSFLGAETGPIYCPLRRPLESGSVCKSRLPSRGRLRLSAVLYSCFLSVVASLSTCAVVVAGQFSCVGIFPFRAAVARPFLPAAVLDLRVLFSVFLLFLLVPKLPPLCLHAYE